MGHTACTEPQCLYKGDLYLYHIYVTNAPKCFGASAPSSGSFDIAFAKLIKY